jgi:predicted MFS family arabinose efflux permease
VNTVPAPALPLSTAPPRRAAWLPPALFALASAFLMADSCIAPAVLGGLRDSFGIGEVALGLVGSLPLMLGALLGLLTGSLADRRRRLPLLLGLLAVGELAALASGWPALSGSFGAFLACRIVAGAAAGAMFPIAYSLVGDWVGPRHRALTASLIDLVWGIGMMAGPAVGTWALATAWGWRGAHVAMAVPGLLFLALFAVLVHEPAREAAATSPGGDADPGAPTRAPTSAATLLRRPSNLLLVLQSLPGNLPWGLLPFWLIAFFHEHRQMEPAQATLLWEMLGIGAALGSLLWGAVGDRLWRRAPAQVPLMCGGVTLLGVAAMVALVHQPPADATLRAVLGLLAGLLIAVVGPNVRAMLLNTNAPRERGRVLAGFGLLDTMGRGVGPLVGGLIVTASGSMLAAMNIAMGCWVVAAVLLLATGAVLRR